MLFLIIYWETGDDLYLAFGILVFFAFLVLLTLTALVPTGNRNPGRLERIARYVSLLLRYVIYKLTPMKKLQQYQIFKHLSYIDLIGRCQPFTDVYDFE